MIGDKLVITDYHKKNGKLIAEGCLSDIRICDRIFIISVAGESGSGKSETAATTAQELEKAGYKIVILGQDDYFKLPPESNAANRKEDLEWVGMQEVNLQLMDEHLKKAKTGTKSFIKPLVIFDDDLIAKETVSLHGVNIIITEGTYTTSLDEADYRAFIDRTYHDTLEHRKQRARDDAESEFIETVLEIEHKIISKHKKRADIVLPPE